VASDSLGTAGLGIGVLAVVVGLLLVVQVPAANQYEETTLAVVGVSALLVLFGLRTALDAARG
jgi:hypothetical protein